MFFSILHKRWRLTLICLCSGIGGGVRFPGCCTWLWNSEKTQGKSFVFQTWFVNERWLFVLLNQKVTIPPPFHRYGRFFCLEQFFESLFRIYLNCTKLWPLGAAVGEQLLWVLVSSNRFFFFFRLYPFRGRHGGSSTAFTASTNISLSEIFFVSLTATSCLTSFVLAPLTLATALLASLRSYFSLLPKFKYYYVPDNIYLFIYLSVLTSVWISGTSVPHTIPWLLK